MLSKEVQINENNLPKKFSLNCMDFINKMIKRKENERLGHESIKEIFNHKFLSDVNFKKLYNKKIKSPLKLYINSDGNFDSKNVYYNKYLFLTNNTKIRYLKIKKNKKEYDHFFQDYYFYFNEFDLYDRKNTKIKNKFINPHKKYNENDEFLLDDIIFFEKTEEIENETTGTLSTEQKGELFIKNRINKKKIIFDKYEIMDKENNEILKEEESLNASILNSDRNVIKAINSEIFKEKLREFLNKN